MTDLRDLGWDDEWTGALGERAGVVGRVIRLDRGWVTALGEEGERRLRTHLHDVAVGDWVVASSDGARIDHVLPPRSTLARRSSDLNATVHVVAANVDHVFLLHALTTPPNPRRLERELVLAFESGAGPVVVLTKADLARDVDETRDRVAAVALGVPVHAVSARTGAGLDRLGAYTSGHRTIALLGASGVGKSTLVNALVGSLRQRTGDVRDNDQRGRHTTTASELIPLPDGGLLVDTPGMRAVSLWSEGHGLEKAFSDVTALAEHCRFADCRHDTEPGCAVRRAIANGTLDPARLASWQRLRAELDVLERETAERDRAAQRGRRRSARPST
jgi:ribosome biogenesis GTPase / thiamine phosphate phosphatase